MRYLVRSFTRVAWDQGSRVDPRTASKSILLKPHRLLFRKPSTCNLCMRSFSSTFPPKDSKDASAKQATPNQVLPGNSSTDLPSTKDSRRSALNQRFSHVMDNVQARVLTASQTLNDITGYSAIDRIKADNEALEQSLAAAQEHVRAARQMYKASNSKRAATQREVTTLLARKDSWSPVDLERFTELYRTDHVLEGEVTSAQEALTTAEVEEQHLGQRLNAGILKRYHEEQIWSDRIRRASTWGTWGLMGMNFLLFVVLQFFAEPWRRKRLVRGVVEQEKDVLSEVRTELEMLRTSLVDRQGTVEADNGRNSRASDEQLQDAPVLVQGGTDSLGTWQESLKSPSKWAAVVADLNSQRMINIRMRDATVIAIEGALVGAVVAGGIAFFALVRP